MRSDEPTKLDLELARKRAEIVAKAVEVFGGKQQAKEWLGRPAMGLDRQRPIELLQTLEGAEIVASFLGRVEYGVYT